jgi:LacI family transcriptional regulator
MEDKPTLRQIAGRLGISPATVSKALSGRNEVGDATRARVLSLARELGYTPGLRKSSGPGQGGEELRVAVIIDEPGRSADRNTFFDDVLAGFRRQAEKYRMETLYLSISGEWRRRPESYGEYARAKRINGVFISGLSLGDPFTAALESPLAPPAVVVDFSVDNPRVGRVEVDNIAAVRLGVDHLAALGHRRIGFLNGHSRAEVSGKRLMGFAASLGINGLPYSGDLVYEGDFTGECGGAAASYFASLGLSAVFCASDLMAVGLIHGLQGLGLRVPGDVSVVGFDNMDFCGLCTPKLTSVAQDRTRLGITACALLHQLMGGGLLGNCVLAPSLVIRESTAPPAPGGPGGTAFIGRDVVWL